MHIRNSASTLFSELIELPQAVGFVSQIAAATDERQESMRTT